VIPKARLMNLSIALMGVLATGVAAGEDKSFRAGPAGNYAHQTVEQVTIGAKAFDTEDLTEQAFGRKSDLLKYGVLPVLVVIENKRDKPLDLREVEVSLVAGDGRHVKSVNPEDVQFAKSQKKPSQVPMPVPLPKKKNPLNRPEIVARAFSARLIPPGDSASGFFYFDAHSESDDKLYVNGMRDARSQQEVMYFEFPLQQ
jgi:hypothetical protein